MDYAGPTVPIIDPQTGEIRQAQVFVAVLGASSYASGRAAGYTWADATWSQGLSDFIGSHQRALAYFHGVPEIIVPDNLRTGVQRANRYEPDLNPTYLHFAQHYGVAVIPARVRKPKDKAKVEAGVLLVERWILTRLRHRRFFSLAELNAEIRRLLEDLNTRPMRLLRQSRRERFEALDRPALKPLPDSPYEFAVYKNAIVNIDYHVAFENHFYSVPYALSRRQVEIRATEQIVEVYHQRLRVASHLRSRTPGRFSTLPACPGPAVQGAHARGPSSPSGMDPRAVDQLGGEGWAPDGSVHPRGPGRPGASAAGLPHLPGGHEPEQILWRPAC